MSKTSNAVDAFLSNYPGKKLSCMKTFINSDLNNGPTGILSIHKGKTKVHRDTINKELFTFFTICEINNPNNTLNDEYFMKKQKGINNKIFIKSENPVRLNDVFSKDDNYDRASWCSELGTTKDVFAGVFKGEDNKYYIAAQAFAENVYKDFKKDFLTKDLSFEQLYYDNKFNYALSLARRNVERIAYDISKSLYVKVATTTDISAYVDENKTYISKPIKSYSHQKCTRPIALINPMLFAGKKQFGVFNRTSPSAKSSQKHFVVSDISNIITTFNMRNNIKTDAFPTTYKTTIDDKFLAEMIKNGWEQKGIDNRETISPILLKILK